MLIKSCFNLSLKEYHSYCIGIEVVGCVEWKWMCLFDVNNSLACVSVATLGWGYMTCNLNKCGSNQCE